MKKSVTDATTRWDVLTIFAGTLLVSLTLVPWYGWQYGYEPATWGLFALFIAWNGLSITAGYHRLWSHKSYQASFPVRLMFALGGALAVQNSIKEWCSGHRTHHRYVDNNEKDPYSAGRGLWFSHIGWMLKDYNGKTDYSNIKDLEKDPLVNWQHDNYYPLSFLMNVILTIVLGFIWGDPIGALLLAGFLRLVLCHHTTFFINSLAHYWGSQPYTDENSAKDNFLVALLTYGEGYHNFHHIFQWDYRNGVRWYQFDPTKWLIWGMAKLQLASGLKRVPDHKIESAVIAMQHKRVSRQLMQSPVFNTERWRSRLEADYADLTNTLNAWAHYRQEWLDIRRQLIVERKQQFRNHWQQTEVDLRTRLDELRQRLADVEQELNLARRRWQLITAEFT